MICLSKSSKYFFNKSIGWLTVTLYFLQDILPLIEDLNNAGIRFVYFSAENELRSRVRFLVEFAKLD